MLSSKHRFHGYNSLRRVYRKSQSVRGNYISLRFSESPKSYRVAVVVSRKVNKSAVKRNRIRRRVYESIRLADNTPSSKDLIFTVYNDKILECSPEELKTAIKDLLDKTSPS
jgi:ribonuclease P protein component